jgi:pyruvate dehydrogenase E2 component (dihydrolipoamide acetyltransferase)
MIESLMSTAQFTLNSHARADRLQGLRQRFKTAHPDLGLAGITINDMVLFAVSRLLPLYPFMNAHKIDDKVLTYKQVHLGMAVDTPRGLMVPVIRNADRLSLAQISIEAKRLAAACQQGTITPDELTGSTFTVTNLGALGIESFTPVINIPEVAILGVCGIELKPIVRDSAETGPALAFRADEVLFVPHIGLSLTINHQVVDGAPAARFLKALCEAIAHIDLYLAR